MPNPDDEQTIATPPGPETAAPGDSATSVSASSDPTAPETDECPDEVDSAAGNPVDAPYEPPDPPEVLEVDATADNAEADEPVEADQLAGTLEPGAAGEEDQQEALNTGEPANQDDEATSGMPDDETQAALPVSVEDEPDSHDEVIDAESGQAELPEEAPGFGWDVLEQPGDNEPYYAWPSPPGAQQRERPLAWIDWRFSLLFPIAIVGAILTLLWSVLSSPGTIEFRVLDAGTGEAIAGAQLMVGNEVYEAGTDGVVVIERPASAVMVDVAADGYYAVQGELNDTMGSTQDVKLRSREMDAGNIASSPVVAIPGIAT